MNNRRFSLLVPWFSDGALSIIQTVMPLLALRLGADAITLGSIGWIAQTVRLPVCFTSGRLSEKTGRAAIIVPSALIIACAAFALAHAISNIQVIVLYAVCMAAVGAFYPPLQAMIGDVSKRGELTGNLGAFNIGWCVGGMAAAILAGWLVKAGLSQTLYTACIGCVIAAALVMIWNKKQCGHKPDAVDQFAGADDSGYLLIIARMGHYLGFFCYAVVRVLFPQIGHSLGWSEPTIALVVAWITIGQGVGMLATSASPWWRGKLWPQIGAQLVMFTAALVTLRAESPILLGMAFFCFGFALSTAYTAALYHGLSSRANKGKNTGIHEAIVAFGGISGSLIGGIAAQYISLRAPYVIIMCLAIVFLAITFRLGFKSSSR